MSTFGSPTIGNSLGVVSWIIAEKLNILQLNYLPEILVLDLK